MPGGDEPVLAIVAPRGLDGVVAAGEHVPCRREIQPSVSQGLGALGGIKADVHGIYVSRKFHTGKIGEK